MSVKLRPNPFSQVTIRHLAGEPSELRVWSVTKSRGATTRNYFKRMRADFNRLCRIAAQAGAPESMASSIEEYVVLAALGLWAPETDLIDPILLEAPIRSGDATSTGRWPAGGFALRGEVWLQHCQGPIAAVRDIPIGCLSHTRPILWHRGWDLGPALPWWPDADCLAAIEAVRRGNPLNSKDLPSLQALADQGILIPAAERAGTPQEERPAVVARDIFRREGFINLPRLLPPGQIAAFRAYWRKLAALDVLPERGEKRNGTHGEPSSMLLLHLLKPLIEHLVGKPIEPAFSYAWIYHRGTELPPHRDRAESRYTVRLLVDYAPATDGPTPWPIFCLSARPKLAGRNPPIRRRCAAALRRGIGALPAGFHHG
jgi:hypothetical protein